jgi:hypothetical protein
MLDMRAIYGVIIVLVLILLVIVGVNSYRHKEHFHDYIRGLWVADDEFCNDAGIDGMILYIGENEGNTHNAYIIMYSADAIVMEKKISITPNELIGARVLFSPIIEKNIQLEDLDTMAPSPDKLQNDVSALHVDDVSEIHLEKIMPLDLVMQIDFTNNCMIWKDDKDSIYAKLYKDNYSSTFG